MSRPLSPGVAVMMFVLLAFGCRSAQMDYSIASLDKDELPPSIETIDQWNQLDPDVKATILDSEFKRYKTLSVSDWNRTSDISDSVRRNLAEKMQTFMGSNGATEVTDETYSKVGAIEAKVRFLSIGTNVIGAHIEYSQDGCEMPDESVNSFKSRDEAEVSGCELLGSGWKSHGLFNHNGSPLEYSDFMEWSH